MELFMNKSVCFVFLVASLAISGYAATTETLVIGPGDRLFIHVTDTPEVDQHPNVTDAGEIPVVGVGNVKVSGLTPAAAATIIHDRMIAAHFMKHPDVSVSIEQYATQNVSVLGEVKASGGYPMRTVHHAVRWQ
jgi:polysaccharide export outer membrane protein